VLRFPEPFSLEGFVHYWLFALLALAAGCQKEVQQDGAALQTKTSSHPIVFGYEKVEEAAVPSGNSNGVYRLFVSNVPPGEELTLYGKNVGGQPLPLYLFAADSLGVLREKKEGEPVGGNSISNFYFVLGTFRKGEPYEYLLGSHDGKLEVSTKIIPFPIEAFGKDRAYVSLTMAEPSALRYQCRGAGFKPKEALVVRSQSISSQVIQEIRADKNGAFEFFLSPVVDEQAGGSASLEIQRVDEALMMEYGWGSEAK
jgi:hypothetical protein